MNKLIIKQIFFLIWALSLYQNIIAQVKTRSYIDDPGRIQRSHNVDMQHLKLEVSFRPEQGLVMGKETILFKTIRDKTDSLFLDAPGIEVIESKLDGRKVRTVTTPEGLIFYFESLKWGTQHNLYVDYKAHPKKGIYFIGWNIKELPEYNPDHLTRKQIWTQGQGIDNRHWFPCYDATNDKLTTETIIHFDSRYKVISNGLLISKKDHSDGTTTWSYKMNKPHLPYLVMIAIGDYKVKQVQSKSGVPVNLFYYPEWEDRMNATYRYSARMIDFFEKETGFKYPWESYSMVPVQNFLYGAMENTTATIYGDFYHVDDRQYLDKNFVGVNAHELAHQWFGDCVTAKARADQWLQESFATHYNMMFEKEVFGQDHLDWARREATVKALKASENDFLPIVNSSAGTVRIYPKGATVLYMLKYVVGHNAYNRAIQYYLNKHAYGNVDTEDLLEAFEETTGLSLNWFWEEWLYKGGEPHYNVSFEDLRIGKGDMRVSCFTIEQMHEMNEVVGLFRMPINFEVVYKDGTTEKKKAWIERKTQQVRLPNPDNKSISYALFDPGSQIMKAVKFKKPLEMLKEQAIDAMYMLDRYDALVSLRDFDINVKRDVLHALFNKDQFHAIRSEIIRQLLDDEDAESRKLIKEVVEKGETKTKIALLNNLNEIPDYLLSGIEQLLSDSSYNIVAAALKLLCNQNPSKFQIYLDSTKNIYGAVGSNVNVTWLEMAYTYTGKNTYADQLAEYVGEEFEFRTRVNAANALKRLDYFNVTLMNNLFNAMCSFNRRLSGPCKNVLKYFYEQDKHHKMILNYYRQSEWDANQKARLEKIFQ